MAQQVNASHDSECENVGVVSDVRAGAPAIHSISYMSLKPHLVIQAPRAADAILFYKQAFGAEEVTRTVHTKRKAEQQQLLILHAHLKFGDAELIICDESEFCVPKKIEAGSHTKGGWFFHVFSVEPLVVEAPTQRSFSCGKLSSLRFVTSVKSPGSLNGTTSILHLETNDVDAAFTLALEAGASVVEEIVDQPWGQRYGKIIDPFGFVWSLATPVKDAGMGAAEEDAA